MKALKDQIRHDLIVTQPILYYRLIIGMLGKRKSNAFLQGGLNRENAMI